MKNNSDIDTKKIFENYIKHRLSISLATCMKNYVNGMDKFISWALAGIGLLTGLIFMSLKVMLSIFTELHVSMFLLILGIAAFIGALCKFYNMITQGQISVGESFETVFPKLFDEARKTADEMGSHTDESSPLNDVQKYLDSMFEENKRIVPRPVRFLHKFTFVKSRDPAITVFTSVFRNIAIQELLIFLFLLCMVTLLAAMAIAIGW